MIKGVKIKIKTFWLLTIILVLVFVGCGNEDTKDLSCSCPNGTEHTDAHCGCDAIGHGCTCTYEAPAQNQNVVLTNLFDESYSVTIQGYLSDAQWVEIPVKIETALNGAYTEANNPIKGRFRAIFGQDGGVTIIIRLV